MANAQSRPVQAEEVYRAARELIAQGQNPTERAVRGLVGRGSANTILKFLNQWRESFKDSAGGLAPAQIPEQIREPMQAFWDAATEVAGQAFVAYRKDMEEKAAKAEDRSRALQDRVTTLERQNADLEAEVYRLTNANLSLKDDNARVESALAEQKEFAKSERLAHAHETAVLKEKMATGEKELLRAGETIDALKVEAENARNAYERQLDSQSKSYEEQLAKADQRFERHDQYLQKQLDQVRQDAEKLETRAAQREHTLKEQAQLLTGELAAKERALREVEMALAVSEKERGLLSNSLEKMTQEKDRAVSRAEHLGAESKQILQSLSEVGSRLKHLEETQAALTKEEGGSTPPGSEDR